VKELREKLTKQAERELDAMLEQVDSAAVMIVGESGMTAEDLVRLKAMKRQDTLRKALLKKLVDSKVEKLLANMEGEDDADNEPANSRD